MNVQNLCGLLRDFCFIKQGSLWGKAERCLDRKIKILWMDHFLSNKINIYETSGELFNLSEPQFLHRLQYLFKEGSCCRLRVPQIVFSKILGGRVGEVPLVPVFGKPCILYSPSWRVKAHTERAVSLFEHPASIHPISSNFLYIHLGIHPSLPVHVDPVQLTPTHLLHPQH